LREAQAMFTCKTQNFTFDNSYKTLNGTVIIMADFEKNITEIQNIYTYFEFSRYNEWEDFDILLSVLVKSMNCKVLEKLDGIYSKHCVLDLDGFIFKLMYHEDFGNCLCNQDKKDDNYYIELEHIAEKLTLNLANN